MEEKFDKLKDKIRNGNDFFDLVAQLIKEMGDYPITAETKNQLKHLKLILSGDIEIALHSSLERAGFSKEEAFSKLNFIMANMFR